MEHIQCPHCQKKYAVNDKLRASIGKNIRCKHCNQAFEIKILLAAVDTPKIKPPTPTTASEEPAIPSPEHEKSPPPSSPTTAAAAKLDEKELMAEQKTTAPVVKKKPARKKVNIQLIITIALVICLIIAGLSAFLFFNQSDVLKDSHKKEAQNILPTEMIKPFEIQPPALQTVQPNAARTELQTEPQTVIEKKPVAVASKLEPSPVEKQKHFTTTTLTNNNSINKDQLSQVCKDTSADYWIRSHSMATSRMDTKTYLKLLDQNITQANEIRKLCKDNKFIGIIAKAARINVRPAWIALEINTRMQVGPVEAHNLSP